MSKNDSKTAIELINVIRDMISTELDKRDNTCVCQIVARNLDETFNKKFDKLILNDESTFDSYDSYKLVFTSLIELIMILIIHL